MLGELPQELVCEVFAHIPAKALVTTVQLVSHPWRELVLDDSVWRRRLLEDLGVGHDHRREMSCFEQYKELVTQTWDRANDKCSISKDGQIASNTSTSFAAAFSARTLSDGVHYFEFEALDSLSDERTCGFGVATKGLAQLQSFLKSNQGIGWYNCGGVYALDSNPTFAYPKFRRGDKCGMEVDLEQGLVHFFFNGVRQGSEGFALDRCEGAVQIKAKASKQGIPVVQPDQELHAVALFKSNRVQLRYLGRQAPAHWVMLASTVPVGPASAASMHVPVGTSF